MIFGTHASTRYSLKFSVHRVVDLLQNRKPVCLQWWWWRVCIFKHKSDWSASKRKPCTDRFDHIRKGWEYVWPLSKIDRCRNVMSEPMSNECVCAWILWNISSLVFAKLRDFRGPKQLRPTNLHLSELSKSDRCWKVIGFRKTTGFSCAPTNL